MALAAAAAAAATVVADLTGNNNCLLSELPQISLPVLVVVANKASSTQADRQVLLRQTQLPVVA